MDDINWFDNLMKPDTKIIVVDKEKEKAKKEKTIMERIINYLMGN